MVLMGSPAWMEVKSHALGGDMSYAMDVDWTMSAYEGSDSDGLVTARAADDSETSNTATDKYVRT